MIISILYALFFVFAGAVCALDFSEYLFFDWKAFFYFLIYWVLPLILASFILFFTNLRTNVYHRNEVRYALYTWIFLVIVDYIMAGGVPVLQKYMGGAGLYTDFKPPLHGLTNAVSLSIACHLPFTKIKRQYLILLILVGYQFSILNRGPLIYHLIAYIAGHVAIQIKSRESKLLLRSMGYVFALLMLFSLIGSFREVSGSEDIKSTFGIDPNFYWMPNALIWILIYFTSPMSNLLYNLSLGEVSCGSGVSALFSTIIPGFVRNMYLQHDPALGDNLACEITGELYHSGLNVSTGFIQYYIDMGELGLIVSALLTACILKRVSSAGIARFDAMSSFCMVILFVSIFAPAYNQLSFLVTFVFIRYWSKVS